MELRNEVSVPEECAKQPTNDVVSDEEKAQHTIEQMPAKLSKPAILIKIAVLGESEVGKTSLLARYIEGTFGNEFIATLGLNVMEKSFELKNCRANIQMYELGGEQYTHQLPETMAQAKVVLFVFDLTQPLSLRAIEKWYKNVRKLNERFDSILVGTKYDLFEQKDVSFKRKIARKARFFANRMHSPLIMCSAKTSVHVKQVFTLVVGCALLRNTIDPIKVKLRQLRDEEKEPLLEYDVIYQEKEKEPMKKKSRRASVHHHSRRHSRGSSSYRTKKKKPLTLTRSSSMAAIEEWSFVPTMKLRKFDDINEDEKETTAAEKIQKNEVNDDEMTTTMYKVNSRPKFDVSDEDEKEVEEEENTLSVT